MQSIADRYYSADSPLQFHADNEPVLECRDGTALIISSSCWSTAQLLVRRNGAMEHIALTLYQGDVLICRA